MSFGITRNYNRHLFITVRFGLDTGHWQMHQSKLVREAIFVGKSGHVVTFMVVLTTNDTVRFDRFVQIKVPCGH